MDLITKARFGPTSIVMPERTCDARRVGYPHWYLDAEKTIASSLFLLAGQKWAIRFEARGMITIVVGMKDYGRGWFSSHFAALVAARLGIPFQMIRLYYTGTLPAVLLQPAALHSAPKPEGISPVAAAATALIGELCEQVIANGKRALAELMGAKPAAVAFYESHSCFSLLDGSRSIDLIDLSKMLRNSVRER